MLPCQHEYHKLCIDPWLIENFTCPLCMYTIVGKQVIVVDVCCFAVEVVVVYIMLLLFWLFWLLLT